MYGRGEVAGTARPGGEAPADGGGVSVAVSVPGPGINHHGRIFGKAAVETLPGQTAQFAFSHTATGQNQMAQRMALHVFPLAMTHHGSAAGTISEM